MALYNTPGTFYTKDFLLGPYEPSFNPDKHSPVHPFPYQSYGQKQAYSIFVGLSFSMSRASFTGLMVHLGLTSLS
jgi:hypothetical protein